MRLLEERILHVVMQANKRANLRLRRKLCAPDAFTVMSTIPTSKELQNDFTKSLLRENLLKNFTKPLVWCENGCQRRSIFSFVLHFVP